MTGVAGLLRGLASELVGPRLDDARQAAGQAGENAHERARRTRDGAEHHRPDSVRVGDVGQGVRVGRAEHGAVDRADIWVGASGDWDYHVLQIRAR